MELLVVGAGAAYPDRPGAASSTYVVEHRGVRLCLDLGQGGFAGLAGRLEPSTLGGGRGEPPASRPLRGPGRAPPLPALRVQAAAPHARARPGRPGGPPGRAPGRARVHRGGPGRRAAARRDGAGRAVRAREPPRDPHGRELRGARRAGRRPGARRASSTRATAGGLGTWRPSSGPATRSWSRSPSGRARSRWATSTSTDRRSVLSPPRRGPAGCSSPTSRCAATRPRPWPPSGQRSTARSPSSPTGRPGPSEESERRGPVVRVPASCAVSGNARLS